MNKAKKMWKVSGKKDVNKKIKITWIFNAFMLDLIWKMNSPAEKKIISKITPYGFYLFHLQLEYFL